MSLHVLYFTFDTPSSSLTWQRRRLHQHCCVHAGEVKVGIFALRDIPVGEELSYDYQFQHYGLAQAAGDYRSDPFCMRS